MLTIVMYHYVRDLENSEFPRIKGLTTEQFDGQLDYLEKHYTSVSVPEVVKAAYEGAALPENPCLLTFDDGLMDHYDTVFPRLQARGMTGAFFPPARAVGGKQVLDTHKVHFILAATEDARRLVKRIFELLKPHRSDHDLPPDEELYSTYATANRFDPAEIVFVKRILQRGLPEVVREAVTAQLFASEVSEDEPAFARRLYMDLSQLRTMAQHGMEIGGHGDRHEWLNTLSPVAQQAELDATVKLLSDVLGKAPANWVMSYPFGAYDDTTLKLCREAGCAVGVTTQVRLADDLSAPLELPRLDTNDLPRDAEAPPTEWTLRSRVPQRRD